MKLTFLLVFIACLQVGATGYSQSITISVKDAPLEKIFQLIENQSEYHFYYKTEDIRGIRDISLEINSVQLSLALEMIFAGQPLSYKIVDKNIIVREKSLEGLQQHVRALQIQGKVIDADNGDPLVGASVVVKGTRIGTATNDEGIFILENVPDNATLIFSYTGYKSREIKVTRDRNITVRLSRSVVKSEEILVNTGLYQRPKESFTGAVTTVTGDELRAVNGLNVLQALKVFDPSVHIPDNIQFGSDPNKLPEITLRGTNNFPTQTGEEDAKPVSGADFSANYMSNPNQPLFILDGFEVSIQKIYDLDISRIASFTILKDAAATSIYGSRAANGVIVVETVQPRPGKLRLSYSGQLQLTAPDLTVYDLTDAAEKLEVERIAGKYSQFSKDIRPDWDAFYRQLYAKRLSWVKQGVNTYWLSQPVHTGLGQQHTLYLEGGDNSIRYGIDFGFSNNAGVMKNSHRNNYSGGMNLSYRYKKLLIKNVLKVEFNKSNNSNYGVFSDYTKQNPYWNPWNENGVPVQVLETYQIPYGGSYTFLNPLYNTTLHTVDQSTYTNIRNTTYAEWKINDRLRISGNMGLTRQTDERDKFLPAGHNSFYDVSDFTERGSYEKVNSNFFSYDGSLKLDLNQPVGKKSFLFNTTGVSIAETNGRYVGVRVTGFPNERMDDIGFGNGYPANSKPDGGNTITRRLSAFSNFNYNYDQRYLADFSVSMDGSSQFGVNKRFAPFWSVGLGWNIHNEGIMKDAKFIDQLRLRGSIGTTGDNRFPPFMGITSYRYYTDQNYRAQVGAVLMGYGNENLQWQQTLKRNLGMDVVLWNNRINFTFNWYKENTKGLILDINTPTSVGVSSYKENVGELENIGFEYTITTFLIKNTKSRTWWSVFVNGNHNENKIKEISNALKKLNEENDKNDQTHPQYRFQEGESVNVIWAVQSKGIDPANGRELYMKKDGTLTYDWDPADKVIAGDNTPDMNGNFGTNFSWRGLSLGLYFQYRFGGQMYNQTLQRRVEGADLDYNVDRRVLEGRWAQPGDVKNYQRLLYASNNIVVPPTYATSRFVQDNDYIHFTSISLGYEVPEHLANKWGMAYLRIGLIGNDLKRWASIQAERGLQYPFARNFTLRINTTFK